MSDRRGRMCAAASRAPAFTPGFSFGGEGRAVVLAGTNWRV